MFCNGYSSCLVRYLVLTLSICSAHTLANYIQGEADIVAIRPYTDVKYFEVPTSEEPVASWMDVRRGLFPNTSRITTPLKVGEPITVFIYLKDNSSLYDIKVTDCWAYDNDNIAESKYKLHLTGGISRFNKPKKPSLMKPWRKYNLPKGSNANGFLYTDMRSFKFPDKEQIHITCDVELCFTTCKTTNTKTDPD